jgi:PAS domain S-box-containing protein/putative nucleotidyltransferase with HDIG domain
MELTKSEVDITLSLTVLIVEDSETDAQLIIRLLKKAGYDIAFEQVETAVQMRAALEKQAWDIVISDHSMPQFSSLAALTLLQETGLDIPFITVSGTMSEEIAVNMMKAGAHDYLTKGNLTRLIPAIERELAQAKVRRERKQAEAALARSERAHRTLFENVPVGLYRTLADGSILDVNPAMVKMFGYQKRDALLAAKIVDLYVDPTADEKFKAEVEKNDNITGFEAEYCRQDGTNFWAREHIHVVRNENGTPLFYEGSLIDITASKRVEEEIRQRLSELEVLYQSGIALSQLVNPKVIAQNIIDLLDQKMDWHHTTIRLYHPQDETLELLAFNHPNLNSEEERRAVEERFRTIIAKKGQGLSGWVVQHHQVVRSGDLKNDLRYVDTFPGLQSGLYVPIKIAERIIGVISIESEQPNAFSKSDERLTITLAAQAAIAINNAQLFDDLQRSNINLTSAYDATIEGWSRAMDLRDKETEGHTLRVTDLTMKLARAMHINESQLINIRRGALLHDIGKMGIPDSILLKPGKLTDEEWEIMRRHPAYAYEMLTPIAYLQTALDIPYYHHEKWDGTGYPRGLKGKQIPLVARIFAIVDVWDALTSDRPYRSAWTKEKSLEYIRGESGKHFDPQVVQTFLRLLSK